MMEKHIYWNCRPVGLLWAAVVALGQNLLLKGRPFPVFMRKIVWKFISFYPYILKIIGFRLESMFSSKIIRNKMISKDVKYYSQVYYIGITQVQTGAQSNYIGYIFMIFFDTLFQYAHLHLIFLFLLFQPYFDIDHELKVKEFRAQLEMLPTDIQFLFKGELTVDCQIFKVIIEDDFPTIAINVFQRQTDYLQHPWLYSASKKYIQQSIEIQGHMRSLLYINPPQYILYNPIMVYLEVSKRSQALIIGNHKQDGVIKIIHSLYGFQGRQFLRNIEDEINQVRLGTKADYKEIEMWKDAEVLDIYEAVVVNASQLYVVIEEAFQVVFLVDSGKFTPPSDSWHHELHQILVMPLVLHLQNHAFNYYQE